MVVPVTMDHLLQERHQTELTNDEVAALQEPLLQHVAQMVDDAARAFNKVDEKQMSTFTKNAIENIKSFAMSFAQDISNLKDNPSQLRELTHEMNQDLQQLAAQNKMDQARFNQFSRLTNIDDVDFNEAMIHQNGNPVQSQFSENEITQAVGTLEVLVKETVQVLDEISPDEVDIFASFAVATGRTFMSAASMVTRNALNDCRREQGKPITDDIGQHPQIEEVNKFTDGKVVRKVMELANKSYEACTEKPLLAIPAMFCSIPLVAATAFPCFSLAVLEWQCPNVFRRILGVYSRIVELTLIMKIIIMAQLRIFLRTAASKLRSLKPKSE